MEVPQEAFDALVATCTQAQTNIDQAMAAAADYEQSAQGADGAMHAALLTLAETERVVAAAWQQHINIVQAFAEQVR